jgi:TolB-like protein/class 3 adenylate cyclase/Tfp pilus assembly protein PilF
LSETHTRLSHRLSVVWFTDLVGYSTLSARDQDRAVAMVQRFQEIVRRSVSDDDRIVKFIGDAALLESPSAEAALQAATALHREMDENLRTGIHLGDVAVASDGDLYGDGVNGAQRIQTEAEPGQIVVSEDVWRRLRNRPAFVFESLGERQLKGIEPMELFRVVSIGARGGGGPDVQAEAPRSSAPEARSPAARSVAVLPFANMSSQADHEFFSDGVTEEILTLLTRIEGLKVISRTSVMQYKGTVKPIRHIGEELGVTTILEGSVRYAGSRVRITAQLIDAATDEHLWADRYDRDLEDIFEIQTDVAERIVEALRLRLTSRERAQLSEKPTEDVEAYQWYLKGRHFLSRRTEATLKQAIDCFRNAVTADPAFAQAWVGLADGLTLLQTYGATPVDQMVEEARAAAEKALALDPRLGDAYVSLGHVALVEWKWEEADRRFRRGLELNPAYVTGYHWYALLLLRTGRMDEAVSMTEKALELDPLSLPVQMAMGVALWWAGRIEESVLVFEKAIGLDPGFATSHLNLANAYMSQGRFEEALDALDAFSRIDPDRQPPETVAELRAGYEAAGERGFWEATLEALGPRIDSLPSGSRYDMAQACARLGRTDEAFDHLDRLVEAREPFTPQFLWDPLMEPLRSDPRFEELKRKLGLA